MNDNPRNEAERGRPQGLSLFYGDDFLVKEELRGLIDAVLDSKLRATNLTIIEGGKLDAGVLEDQLYTPSLFGGDRVIVVEQTHLFMGKSNRGKLLEKTVSAWGSDDRARALSLVAQLVELSGLGAEELALGTDWIDDIGGQGADSSVRETLVAVGKAYVEERPGVQPTGQEARIREIIEAPIPEGAFLVFTSSGVDKRNKLYKLAEKHGRVVECAVRQEKYSPSMEKGFFEERVRHGLNKHGKKISSRALEKMRDKAGMDIRQLESEIEKLARYVGDRQEVTEEDVNQVLGDYHQAAFYELTQSLRTGDAATCLKALDSNLKIVDHPLQSLAGIANEIRRLIVAREILFTVFKPYWTKGMSYQNFRKVVGRVREEQPKKTGAEKYHLLSMKDYPLYLLLRDVQKFPMEKLTKAMEAILEADIAMKSSRLGSRAPGIIVERLLMEICSKN